MSWLKGNTVRSYKLWAVEAEEVEDCNSRSMNSKADMLSCNTIVSHM